MTLSDLHQISPITRVVERLFYYLQFISPVTWIAKTRSQVQNNQKADELTVARRRGPQVEYVVLVFLLIEVLAFVIIRSVSPVVQVLIMLPVAYRLIDVFQVSVNVSLFDRLRIKRDTYKVAALTRTLILTFINYLEVWFCFAILYSTSTFPIRSTGTSIDWIDTLLFSTGNQLTLVFGVITPSPETRILAILQGFFAFFLTVIVISRVVGLLPKIEPLIGDN